MAEFNVARTGSSPTIDKTAFVSSAFTPGTIRAGNGQMFAQNTLNHPVHRAVQGAVGYADYDPNGVAGNLDYVC